ncbi:MAG: hypothetical protein C4560_03010 [Nitrospiraceae bacterium]|nr:MAG: hypothetical protein C4560_03010 [Nitrospiraceae bacterium]
MKEITTMNKETVPILLLRDNEYEVYGYRQQLCCETEYLGRALEYKNPAARLRELKSDNLDMFEGHVFPVNMAEVSSVSNLRNPKGGRPSNLWDEDAIVAAFMLAKKPSVKRRGQKLIARLRKMHDQKFIMTQTQHENYWFGGARRTHWKEVRERALKGESYRDIADAMQIKRDRVSRAVRSMSRVGLIDPHEIAEVQKGPASKAARELAMTWGQPTLFDYLQEGTDEKRNHM